MEKAAHYVFRHMRWKFIHNHCGMFPINYLLFTCVVLLCVH